MSAISSINPEPQENSSPTLIDPDLIDKYCEANNTNVFNLLTDITEIGSEQLANFLSENGGPTIENKSKGVLHGSINLFEQFEPRVSDGGPNENRHEPLVYASVDPNYAIFMGIAHNKGGRHSVGYYDGKIKCRVDLSFVNGPSKIADGYVYVLDGSLFEGGDPNHLTSPNAQKPLFVVPVKPQDLQTEIKIDLQD